MYLDRISCAHSETPLIARDALARRQWEAAVAGRDASSGQGAWPSRAFTSFPQWLAGCFERAEAASGTPRRTLLLSSSQAERLFRRIIETSPHGQSLLGSGGVARWAKSARRVLLEHGLAPAEQGGRLWQGDAAVFLAWNREFEAELESNGWVDPDSLLYRVNRLPLEAVAHAAILLDPPRPAPEARRLIESWRAAGQSIDLIEPDDRQADVGALVAADPSDEIRLAAEWAAARLRERPGERLVVVAADLDARRSEVESVFTDHLGKANVTIADGRPIGDFAILGAALTGLRLIGPDAGFGVLGRWLRSPFFSSEDAARARHAAMLEIELRQDPRAQRDVAGAWRRLGLKGRFERSLPDTARRLDRAFDRLPRRATPTTWTAVWQSCLRFLGWQGFEIGLPARLQTAWDNAWARFSELTAILGAVDQATALDLFDEIAAAETVHEPVALEGVVIVSRMGQVGPGFAGAWVTGFTDESQLPGDSPNPLLPWAVQEQLDLPGARPDTALVDAVADLNRLRRRVAEARFSCPARIGDEPRMPSPLIGGWQRATARSTTAAPGASRARARIGARAWQQVLDAAPALEGDRIPGGARTLNLQSGCPAKAFCIARLGAWPIEPPVRGIDPRLRGLLVHRALELLFDPGSAGPLESRIDAAIGRSFAELEPRGDAWWETQMRAERGRIGGNLARFLEVEAGRPAFTTLAVERRTRIEIAGLCLDCRIDRIDGLASGRTLLIDYKTGQSQPAGWFESRLGDCQLPAYAQDVRPAAIAAIGLGDGETVYRWAAEAPVALPGKGRVFDAAGWQAQIERWREQIGHLLDEFARGDVRVPADAAERVGSDGRGRAGGAFAPLTRVGDLR